MLGRPQTVVFLHGAGQTEASWDGVITALPPGVCGVAAALQVLPARAFRAGVDKQTLLNLLVVARDVDFRDALGNVSTRTLVMCGAKDRANLPAARALAAGIPHARLKVIPGAGHTWNVDHPARFAHIVADFILSPQSGSTPRTRPTSSGVAD